MDKRNSVQFESLRTEFRGLSEKVIYASRIAVIEEKLKELEKKTIHTITISELHSGQFILSRKLGLSSITRLANQSDLIL
jgi:hypothetical protein